MTDRCERCHTPIERTGVMVVLYGQKALPKNVKVICDKCERKIDMRGAKV